LRVTVYTVISFSACWSEYRRIILEQVYFNQINRIKIILQPLSPRSSSISPEVRQKYQGSYKFWLKDKPARFLRETEVLTNSGLLIRYQVDRGVRSCSLQPTREQHLICLSLFTQVLRSIHAILSHPTSCKAHSPPLSPLQDNHYVARRWAD